MKRICYILTLILSISLLAACESRPSGSDQTVIPNATDRINNIFSTEAIECRFYSVEDLETYLFTGSTRATNYEILPEFDTFPQIDDHKTYEYAKAGYVSLEKAYGICIDDIDSFDSVTFQLSRDFIIYKYYFDTNLITVIFSPVCFKGLSTSDYYSALSDYLSVSYSPIRYAESLNIVDGYVSRECGEKEIVYTYRNGIPRIAGILQDDYFISVTTASSSDVEEARTEYLHFMASKDFASVSALFSTDPETFGTALQNTEKFNSK